MNNGAGPGLRTLAFGDLETGLWGAALGTADAVAAVGSLDSASPLSAASARLEGADSGTDWELTGPELRLRLTPHETTSSGPAGDRFAQLCRVRGSVVVDGVGRDVDCLGLRSYAADADLHSLDSVRQVLAWFAPDDGIALSSRRPRGAKGHDRDAVAAIVLEPDGPVAVAEGRLSTTYAQSGLPARVGLELWLTEEDDQFPRRVAGEALGVGADGQAVDLAVGLHAFRCHSRGRDGGGAYLVARPR
jgi:hypothetical protein